jgi:hypothetical protein
MVASILPKTASPLSCAGVSAVDQECSPSAQGKAVVAHVQRLKLNQRNKK